MDGKWIRRSLFGLALFVCLACWAYTFGSLALYGHPGASQWIARVTVSAVATEVLLWVGAFTLGWSLLERRRALWQRLASKRQSPRSDSPG